CGAVKLAQKNSVVAHRHGATLVASPHLAYHPDDSARDFTQWISARRSDDHVPHSPLWSRDGERILRTLPPACNAAVDEGAVAGRDCVRTDSPHPLSARGRGGKNARFVQAG